MANAGLDEPKLLRVLQSLEEIVGRMVVRVSHLDEHTSTLKKTLQYVDKKVHKLEISDGSNEAERRFQEYEHGLGRDAFFALKENYQEMREKNILGQRALKQLFRRELVSCFEGWANYVREIHSAMRTAGQNDDEDSVQDADGKESKGTGVERMRERILITSTEKNQLNLMVILTNLTSASGRKMLFSLFLRNVAGISRSEPQKGIDGSRLIHPSSPLFSFWDGITGACLIITAYLVPIHLSIWDDERFVSSFAHRAEAGGQSRLLRRG